MTIGFKGNSYHSIVLFCAALMCCHLSCSKSSNDNVGTNPPSVTPPPSTDSSDVAFWLTAANQSALFTKQKTSLLFGNITNQYPDITVGSTQTFQTIDGFGYTLTGASAELIVGLSVQRRDVLLKELFSTDNTSIGVSYLRVSIGASDLSSNVYTYDDMISGETDSTLANFSLDKDKQKLIPLLKQILAINPDIKILATPWTAPVWMKTNGSSVGGKLAPAYYSVYANYFVKYITAMKDEGITIDAITPQNEPMNPFNNPSMEMTAGEQTDFIKNHLGPKLQAAGLDTKIIIYDHNADRTDYPLSVLSDAKARQYADGTAFHLYAGDISALTPVHNAYPEKNIYFTEQYTSSTGDFGGDLAWHIKNLVIGATRNWSRNVLEWNLANDPSYGPHTEGGCATCKGAITIFGDNYSRNVSYYIVSHASKFVRPGSVRIASNIANDLQNVAFKTPDGKKVLIILNNSSTVKFFNITFKEKWVTASLDAGAVGTFIW